MHISLFNQADGTIVNPQVRIDITKLIGLNSGARVWRASFCFYTI